MSSKVDVLTFGEAMVAFRCDATLSAGSTWTTRLAGAESNVAIGLARLGHQARWVGRVGADPFGELIVGQLRAEGVDTEHVVRDEARPTGLMFVERRTADIARVEYRRDHSAGSALSPDDVLPVLADGARVVHLTGITPALAASSRDTVLSVATAARAAGATVALDVNYRNRLWSREQARETLSQVVALVDVVIASDDELDLLTPAEEDEDAAVAALLGAGATHVAVKRGASGASLWCDGERHDAAAVPVTAVDALGAGDAFSTGLLSGLLDGLTGPECLRRGTVLGAFAASSPGDWEGLPRRSELHLLDGLRPGTALR
jgi:2-dehydro-3-deoxygluconokinase